MKKKYLVSALVLTIILLIGCGKKDASNSAGSDERIEIVCLSCRPNDQLDEDIIEFNNSQTQYKVVKREYDADADEKINLDIAQGNYPDLYDVSEGVGRFSVGDCVKKGLFESLDSYIEKDDKLCKEDIIPSVYESFKINDNVYYMAADFTISSIAVKASDVKQNDWTFDEFKDFIDAKDEKEKAKKLFETTNKVHILNLILEGCGNEFIDVENGKCFFDSQEFGDVLEIANRDVGVEMNENEVFEDSSVAIPAGEQMMDCVEITPENIIWERTLFKGDLKFIGYPNDEKKLAFFNYENALAMSKQSANKQGAWEFIKWHMTKEYQGEKYRFMEGTPTREDVFNVAMKSLTATEQYEDEFGNTISSNAGSLGFGSLTVEYDYIPEDVVEEYKTLVNNSSKTSFNDKNIMKIIDDESKGYFYDGKSIDEVKKVIQKRVSLYLGELN